MRVTYFDEVKASLGNGQKHYFVGGVSIDAENMPEIEDSIQQVARSFFGKDNISQETEFHASYIYSGKSHFKGVPPLERVEILGKLADIISHYDANMKRVYVAIDTTKIYKAEQAPEIAFAYFCERVQRSLQGEKTIMIGDRDDQYAKAMIKSFAEYRENGTPFPHGINISGLMDAVHFAHSHHSRFLQIADVYLFLETHRFGTRTGWMADKLSERIKGLNLYPHRYKEWPK